MDVCNIVDVVNDENDNNNDVNIVYNHDFEVQNESLPENQIGELFIFAFLQFLHLLVLISQ